MLTRQIGGMPVLRGQYIDMAKPANAFAGVATPGPYRATDGGRFLAWWKTDNTCTEATVLLRPNLWLSAPWAQARIQNVAAQRPHLKVGSSPFGVYESDPASGASGSPVSVYQDSEEWLRRGIQDYLSPQMYWDIDASRGDPDFARLAERWQQGASGRHIYAGIGAYKPEVASQIPRQIDVTRGAGNQGQAFFRFGQPREGHLQYSFRLTDALNAYIPAWSNDYFWSPVLRRWQGGKFTLPSGEITVTSAERASERARALRDAMASQG